MRVRSLFDEKKKARVREAIARNDTSIFRKKKAEPGQAQTKPLKKQLSPGEQNRVNEQLIDAALKGNFDSAKEALEKGADPDSKEWIKIENGTLVKVTQTVLSVIVTEWDIERNRSIIDKPENWQKKKDRMDALKKIMELLLTSGADPNVTFNAELILGYFKHKDSQIYDLFKRYGAKE